MTDPKTTRTRRLRSLFVVGTVAALLAAVSPANGQEGAPEAEPADPPTAETADPASTLSDSALRRALSDWAATSRDGLTLSAVPEVTVEVFFDGDPGPAREAVELAGGEITGEVVGSLLQADVPVDRLEILESNPAVTSISAAQTTAPMEPPDPGTGQAVTVEALAESNADAWQAAGYSGSGMRVGIVDFFNLTDWNSAVASGDLVAAAGTHCVRLGQSCEIWATRTLGTGHGVAVAEVIHEFAPDAQLYIASATTASDLETVVDWFDANGVDVVSRSLTAPYDGPGDGTGDIADVVNRAVSLGMAWFNSAGNSAGVSGSGEYWRGSWSDPDDDSWLDFATGDEDLEYNCKFVNGVRWSDFSAGTSATDYDVYVYEQPDQGGALLWSSTNRQGGGAKPIERDFGCRKNANGDSIDAYLRIWRYGEGNGTTGETIEFMINAGDVERSSNPYSASGPVADSANPGVMAVGAIDPAGGDDIGSYSSQGPTNDSRIKPDFSAQSCLMTNTYNAYGLCFRGTSAATPVLAGAAALVLESGVATSPTGLMDWLRSNAAADRGAAGVDNTYGAGELLLPAPSSAICPPDDVYEPNDSRAAAAPVTSGTRVSGITCNDDYFGIDAQAGQQIGVDLQFTHADGDIDARLFDASGAEVAVSESLTDDESISHTAASSGTYAVRVYGFQGAENSYDLTVDVTGICPPDDVYEPNDSRAAATSVTSGTRVSGITCNDDYFGIDAQAGQQIGVDLQFTHADGDIDARLFDASGAEVAVSESLTDDESISHTAASSGTYAVRVYGYQGAENSYDLTVDVTGICPPDDVYEPNDSRAAATPVTSGTRVSGITCNDDYFGIDAQAGQPIDVHAQFLHDSGDIDIELFSPGGVFLDRSQSIENEETISARASETGRYTVRVYGYQDAENHFDITITLGPAEPCSSDPPVPFNDVGDNYATVHIACIAALGVTTGTTATTYDPQGLVTREQMAAFLSRLYKAILGEYPPTAAVPFTDINPASFGYDDIRRIFYLEVTTGTSASTFSPNDFVTREQMATFLSRLYERIAGLPAQDVLVPFVDLDPTSFGYGHIRGIYGLGITTGTSPTTFDPHGLVTREQMAAFLGRLYEVLIQGG